MLRVIKCNLTTYRSPCPVPATMVAAEVPDSDQLNLVSYRLINKEAHVSNILMQLVLYL